MSDSVRLADVWVRRFEALRDAELRIGFARHALARLTPDTLSTLVAALAAGAELGSAAHRDVLQTVFVALADPELRELRNEAAARAGEPELARLLALAPAQEGRRRSVPAPRAAGKDGGGRPLTLGERKSLARARDRQVLARALRDPDPAVTRILLANPAVTEDDVLRLCVARPIDPDALREVYRCPRWSVRTRIRLAIVKNPDCPLDIAVQIASQLRSTDARDVATAEDLRIEIRRAAAKTEPPRTLH